MVGLVGTDWGRELVFDDCGGGRRQWLYAMVVELDTARSRWRVHNISVTPGGYMFMCLGREREGSIGWLGLKWWEGGSNCALWWWLGNSRPGLVGVGMSHEFNGNG